MSTEDDIETDSGTAGNTPRTRTEALIHLLGDDDIDIRSEVWGHLEKLGKEALESAEAAAAAAGIAAIAQPGGTRGDDAVIEACNEHDIAMVFTGRRHFKH